MDGAATWKSAALVTLLAAGSGAFAQDDDGASTSCSADTSALAVLVDQTELPYNIPARRSGVGQSMVASLIATALTGGTIAQVIHYGNDPGALATVPEPYASEVRAVEVPRQLLRALLGEIGDSAGIAPAHAHTFASGEEVDRLVENTSCGRVLIVNAAYELRQVRKGVQLLMAAEVSSAPARAMADRATRAVVEYRSHLLSDHRADSNNQAAAASAAQVMASESAVVLAQLRHASLELARMIAFSSAAGAADTTDSLTLGRSGLKVECADCERDDRLVRNETRRVWLRPEKHPLLLRSVPVVETAAAR